MAELDPDLSAALREAERRLAESEARAREVGHDFSNLLTVVMSVSRLLRDRLAQDAPALAMLHDLDAAATRAAQLTRRLASTPQEPSPPGQGGAVDPTLVTYSSSSPSPAPSREGARVLLVEDEALVRSGMERSLRAAGHRVYAAAALELALAVVRSGADLDLLVTDVGMPDADGPAVAAAVRALRPGLPVLFVSGQPLRGRALPGAVLEKPFTPSALRAAVAQLLADPAAGAGPKR